MKITGKQSHNELVTSLHQRHKLCWRLHQRLAQPYFERQYAWSPNSWFQIFRLTESSPNYFYRCVREGRFDSLKKSQFKFLWGQFNAEWLRIDLYGKRCKIFGSQPRGFVRAMWKLWPQMFATDFPTTAIFFTTFWLLSLKTICDNSRSGKTLDK